MTPSGWGAGSTTICARRSYILAVHVPIAGIALAPVLFGFPLLLGPIHVVFLELIIDPASSIVFEAEPDEAGLMARPPRSTDSQIVPPRMAGWSLLQGALFVGRLGCRDRLPALPGRCPNTSYARWSSCRWC